MKSYLLFYLLISFINPIFSESCPSGCYCNDLKTGIPEILRSIGYETGYKINCHPLSEPELMNFGSLPRNTLQLDLAKYGLTQISHSYFKAIPYLEKLDVQSNHISIIEEGSFRSLNKLLFLDLSRNSLKLITDKTFQGLSKLTRLKLNDNRITSILKGSFDTLTSLIKLDVSDNLFLCDCRLLPFLRWSSSISLANPSKTTCSLPIHLADFPLRKAAYKLSCYESSEGLVDYTPTLKPENALITFEGDILRLVCILRVNVRNDGQIWKLKGKPVSDYEEISVSSTTDETHLKSVLTVSPTRAIHSGDWSCHANSASRSVDVLVIPEGSKICPQSVDRTSKGTYLWGPSLGGLTRKLSCVVSGSKYASKVCRENGVWSEANVSHCPYVSEFTDSLHKFAAMNLTRFDEGSLLQSANGLRNFTQDISKVFSDPADLQYLAEALRNYIPRLHSSIPQLAEYILDIISGVLSMDRNFLVRSEEKLSAITELRHIVMNVSFLLPGLSYSDPSRSLFLSRISGSKKELVCGWTKHYHDCLYKDFFDRGVLGTAIFPPDPSRAPLRILGFVNSSLFIDPNEKVLTHFVLGVWSEKKGDSRAFDSPLRIRIPHTPVQGNFEPVHWTGSKWQTGYCSDLTPSGEFLCPGPGFFTLRKTEALRSLSADRSVMLYSSFPLLFSFCFLILLYGSMSSHPCRGMCLSLINLWISSALLLYIFVEGVSLSNDKYICAFIGALLHYSTLSSLIWFLLGINSLYFKVSSCQQRPLFSSSQNDDGGSLKYMLLGWGLPLILVGTTTGYKSEIYASSSFCFLSGFQFLGLLIVPWSLITSLLIGFTLSVYCLLYSPPSHITESVDKISVVSSILEGKNETKFLLKAFGYQYLLFTILWIFGACSFAAPITGSYTEKTLFSWLFAIFSIFYSIILLITFLILQQTLLSKLKTLFHSPKNKTESVEELNHLVCSRLPPITAPPPSMATESYARYQESKDVSSEMSALKASGGYIAPVNSEAEYSWIHPKTSSPADYRAPLPESTGISPLLQVVPPSYYSSLPKPENSIYRQQQMRYRSTTSIDEQFGDVHRKHGSKSKRTKRTHKKKANRKSVDSGKYPGPPPAPPTLDKVSEDLNSSQYSDLNNRETCV